MIFFRHSAGYRRLYYPMTQPIKDAVEVVCAA